MKSAVVQLPGLNRDRDMIAALTKISGKAPVTVWQTETDLPDVDLIVIPGGFSYGDYLRCGAIAARMPVMQAIKAKAEAMGQMIRAGVEPENAAAQVGLDVDFTGAVPVSLRLPETDAQALEGP